MPIDTNYAGRPVYARFRDFTDVRRADDMDDARLRKTSVYMHPEDRTLLVVACHDNKYRPDHKPARLTVEQAVELRAAIDEFLSDQTRPASDFDAPAATRPAGTGTRAKPHL